MTRSRDESPIDRPVEDATDLVGVPDHFQRLWTPHRVAYVSDHTQPTADDCPFCEAPGKSDEDALIVHRGVLAYVIMNLYPYNAGHMLVCPYRHVSLYYEASEAEVDEMSRLTRTAMEVLRDVSHPAGFNIGMNQGKVAGAGVAAHLHQHIVPRWGGDANFFPIIAQTKTVPFLLGQMRDDLATAWPA